MQNGQINPEINRDVAETSVFSQGKDSLVEPSDRAEGADAEDGEAVAWLLVSFLPCSAANLVQSITKCPLHLCETSLPCKDITSHVPPCY